MVQFPCGYMSMVQFLCSYMSMVQFPCSYMSMVQFLCSYMSMVQFLCSYTYAQLIDLAQQETVISKILNHKLLSYVVLRESTCKIRLA